LWFIGEDGVDWIGKEDYDWEAKMKKKKVSNMPHFLLYQIRNVE
jgi:hypothetical protein